MSGISTYHCSVWGIRSVMLQFDSHNILFLLVHSEMLFYWLMCILCGLLKLLSNAPMCMPIYNFLGVIPVDPLSQGVWGGKGWGGWRKREGRIGGEARGESEDREVCFICCSNCLRGIDWGDQTSRFSPDNPDLEVSFPESWMLSVGHGNVPVWLYKSRSGLGAYHSNEE